MRCCGCPEAGPDRRLCGGGPEQGCDQCPNDRYRHQRFRRLGAPASAACTPQRRPLQRMRVVARRWQRRCRRHRPGWRRPRGKAVGRRESRRGSRTRRGSLQSEGSEQGMQTGIAHHCMTRKPQPARTGSGRPDRQAIRTLPPNTFRRHASRRTRLRATGSACGTRPALFENRILTDMPAAVRPARQTAAARPARRCGTPCSTG